jgi:hypothetical protein
VRDVPAAAVAIVIVIAGDAVEAARVAAQAEVREVTVVAIPAAVADAEEDRNVLGVGTRSREGHGFHILPKNIV